VTDRAGRRNAARHAFVLLALTALLATAAACSSKPKYVEPPDIDEALTSNKELNQQLNVLASRTFDSNDYRIGPEDMLELTLFDLENTQGDPRVVRARVSNSGMVALPYVGTVEAAGLSPQEFEARLRESYRRYIHDPQLTIFIREYRSFRVSIIGYVNTPGVIDLRGRKTLVEVIAMAGGLTDEAGKNVRVTRNGSEGAQMLLVDLDRLADEGDVSLNIELEPGDVVTVPKAGTFYVEGVVKKPGAYPLLQKMTVSQAIATAGGADDSLAKLSATTLYRKTAQGERVAIPVNLDGLRDGTAEDLALREDDVIIVPLSGTKFWVDRLTRGLLHVGLTAPVL
jgi:polysaccharide export outer membrane protein